ncbi:hypothetical protein [Cellulomonas fimi]|uniref:Integral membrane protein n=1 Tax=Cellulomonas fimi (strain ATCC 484 / DSM 20113 / JCM 1341 / CCUG 24087 / LMG 16345 / NBRC 15513 / NCIMB 8980 / NCTC 7547 / NRS-133) TaxID=590998 RepID=F4H2L4_CELFA|nr:hypothetical protein [Cellulomonas fimi]AEE45240.1 hypothetical protein Celf_1105 [Cellulomonas fimi ATCC 484]NNH07094.1 hypothetical protein [Cellulomonas fimi]VEH28676.1 Uncharacterised protein [Cellulomonas fimi]
MELLQHVLLFLHLLGWAIVLGGTIVTMRDTRLPRGALHGILTALVTGILMVGLASASDELRDPNTTKVAVKLVVALVVTGLVVYGARRPEKVTKGLLGAVLGLTVLNVGIAVLWR